MPRRGLRHARGHVCACAADGPDGVALRGSHQPDLGRAIQEPDLAGYIVLRAQSSRRTTCAVSDRHRSPETTFTGHACRRARGHLCRPGRRQGGQRQRRRRIASKKRRHGRRKISRTSWIASIECHDGRRPFFAARTGRRPDARAAPRRRHLRRVHRRRRRSTAAWQA